VLEADEVVVESVLVDAEASPGSFGVIEAAVEVALDAVDAVDAVPMEMQVEAFLVEEEPQLRSANLEGGSWGVGQQPPRRSAAASSELSTSSAGSDDALDASVAFDVEVAVTASQPDEEEVAKQRQAVFLDAVLATAEATLSTFASRTKDLLTPEEKKGWSTLRSFKGGESASEQKAARAKERALDEIEKGISRK